MSFVLLSGKFVFNDFTENLGSLFGIVSNVFGSPIGFLTNDVGTLFGEVSNFL